MLTIRKTTFITLIALIIIASLTYTLLERRHDTALAQRHPGYLEANLTYVAASQVSGRLMHLYVHRGQAVKKGDALFQLDRTPYHFQQAIDRANAHAGIAKYQDTLTGKRQPYINQLQAEIAEQRANLSYLHKTYLRNTHLVLHSHASQAQFDLSASQYHQAQQQLHALQAQLDIAKLAARQQQIQQAQWSSKAIIANANLAHWMEQQTTVQSPVTGRIFDTFYWPGEVVTTAHPVVAIFVPKQVRLIFYVTERNLATVKLGQRVSFYRDNDQQAYYAKISYISDQAEYTPPVIYSASTRADLVYRIEATPEENHHEQPWHPGQPVSVRLEDKPHA